jgi:hypothetical protein
MALFGRKNAASDADEELTAPVSQDAADETDLIPDEDEESDNVTKLDLDAFANDFGTTSTPRTTGSLDDELNALNNPTTGDFSDDDPDAFGSDPAGETADGPEPLDLNKMYEVESRQAMASGKAPAPFVPASLAEGGIPEPETPFYDPQVALPPVPEKKKLPLVPILGVVTLLVVGGGAALLLRGGASEEAVSPPAPMSAPDTSSASAPSAAPGAPAAPLASTASKAAATVPLTPQLEQQLKALWKKGAAAKQNKDYSGARAAWQQALKLRPNHPGFAESIAKLPQ